MRILFTIVSPFQPDLSLSCVDSEKHRLKNRSIRFFFRKNTINPITEKKEPTGLFTIREIFLLEDLLSEFKEKIKSVLMDEIHDQDKPRKELPDNASETEKLFREMTNEAIQRKPRKKDVWDE